jgi:hypothetical protein
MNPKPACFLSDSLCLNREVINLLTSIAPQCSGYISKLLEDALENCTSRLTKNGEAVRVLASAFRQEFIKDIGRVFDFNQVPMLFKLFTARIYFYSGLASVCLSQACPA